MLISELLYTSSHGSTALIIHVTESVIYPSIEP